MFVTYVQHALTVTGVKQSLTSIGVSKMLKKINGKLVSVFTAVSAVVVAPQAMAAEAVYTTLTDAVTFANVIIAIMAIAAIMAALYVVRKGVYLILGMLKTKG